VPQQRQTDEGYQAKTDTDRVPSGRKELLHQQTSPRSQRTGHRQTNAHRYHAAGQSNPNPAGKAQSPQNHPNAAHGPELCLDPRFRSPPEGPAGLLNGKATDGALSGTRSMRDETGRTGAGRRGFLPLLLSGKPLC
jgi:hypothetical protein